MINVKQNLHPSMFSILYFFTLGLVWTFLDVCVAHDSLTSKTRSENGLTNVSASEGYMEGFRGYSWGTDLSKMKKIISTYNDYPTIRRDTLGDVWATTNIKSIAGEAIKCEVHFYNRKFYQVRITLLNRDDEVKFRDAVTAKYGSVTSHIDGVLQQGVLGNVLFDLYEWSDEKTERELMMNRYFCDTSGNRVRTDALFWMTSKCIDGLRALDDHAKTKKELERKRREDSTDIEKAKGEF